MPPKKKNKPGRNGFVYFMFELRDKSSKRFGNNQELQDYAGQRWRAMTKEQKEPYEDMAMLAKNNAGRVKYTTDQIPIENVEREIQEKQEKISDMKANIQQVIQEAKVRGCLHEEVFLILHINQLVYYPPKDLFYACEIAIAAFTLKDGVNSDSVYHRIIKPGKLPLGYLGTAKIFSQNTHQLVDIVQDDPCEYNTDEVFSDMLTFMEKYAKNGCLPILYANEKNVEDFQKIITNWCYEFELKNHIKVYNLQYMFYILRNAVSDDSKPTWASDTFSRSEIEKDIYCYNAGISCGHHEEADNTVNCSQSIVTRYAYVICDNCCPDMNIRMVPGFHVPVGSKIINSNLISRANSMASNINSDSGFTRVYRKKPSSISGGFDSNWAALGATSTSSISSGYNPGRPPARTVRPGDGDPGRSFSTLTIGGACDDARSKVIKLPPRRPIHELTTSKKK